jgi:hypothetical protein
MSEPAPTSAVTEAPTPADTVEKTEAETIKWDETHNDPNAEIILASSDGIRFRLHAWNLRRKRLVARCLP